MFHYTSNICTTMYLVFKPYHVFLSCNFSNKELLINLMCYFLCMAKIIPCHQTIHITICLAYVTMEELTI
jgi:hypothetical protein